MCKFRFPLSYFENESSCPHVSIWWEHCQGMQITDFQNAIDLTNEIPFSNFVFVVILFWVRNLWLRVLVSHIWVSASQHIKVIDYFACHFACHTYECMTPSLDVTHMSTFLRCECVISHVWMSQCSVTHTSVCVRESEYFACHKYRWMTARLRVTHLWVFSSLWMSLWERLSRRLPGTPNRLGLDRKLPS